MTAFHHKIHQRLVEIRADDGIWLRPSDIAYAYKPLKMGIRSSDLIKDWEDFVDSYDRVNATCSKLFRVELSKMERDEDLEKFHELMDIVKTNQMIQDTSYLLTQEIKRGKARILAEDCISSLMDSDHGIYPYTESFHTVTGAVCTGLGVPDEAIETEIGVMSAITILRKNFL